MTNEAIKKVLGMDISKSKKMIELYDGGMEIKDIAVAMGVRYNFVYNVISNYCRINDVTLRVVEKENKKQVIIEMIEKGMSNVDISAETKCCYNYVFNVRKTYEMAKAK